MACKSEGVAAAVRAAAAVVGEHRVELSELDRAIGDGDHGENLNRGFTAVVAALDGFEADGPGQVFVKTGTTLISKVGGASGPLYGQAFRALGKALTGPEADTAAFGAGLRDSLAAIQKLGAAAPGDKTMVDALGPAVEAFERAAPEGFAAAAAAAAGAAEAGAKETTALQARKGRASYLGPRSVGHQDPGATSTALILRALAGTVA